MKRARLTHFREKNCGRFRIANKQILGTWVGKPATFLKRDSKTGVSLE